MFKREHGPGGLLNIVLGQSFVRELLREHRVELSALTVKPAPFAAVEFLAKGFVNGFTAVREPLLPHQSVESRKRLPVDCDGYFGAARNPLPA